MDGWLLAGSTGGRRGPAKPQGLLGSSRGWLQAGDEPPVPREGKEPPAQWVCPVGLEWGESWMWGCVWHLLGRHGGCSEGCSACPICPGAPDLCCPYGAQAAGACPGLAASFLSAAQGS